MKKTRLDKKTRLKLKALALLESPYNFSGSQSWVRGFSIHGAKSKSSTMEAISLEHIMFGNCQVPPNKFAAIGVV